MRSCPTKKQGPNTVTINTKAHKNLGTQLDNKGGYRTKDTDLQKTDTHFTLTKQGKSMRFTKKQKRKSQSRNPTLEIEQTMPTEESHLQPPCSTRRVHKIFHGLQILATSPLNPKLPPPNLFYSIPRIKEEPRQQHQSNSTGVKRKGSIGPQVREIYLGY